MPFRDPVTTLPADAITGPIQGSQLAADAIDGMVITGATVRTSAGYPRIELAPDGNLYFYPAAGMDAALIRVDGEAGALQIIGPNADGIEYGVTFQKAFGVSTTILDTDETQVLGVLTAGNMAWGRVAITPAAANTPASVTVSGLGLAGTVARAQATASSTVPGTRITEVSCSGQTPDSVTIWLTATDTAQRFVDYLMIAS